MCPIRYFDADHSFRRPNYSVRMACIALTLFPWQNASAADGSTRQYGARETPQVGGGYFVEFRARRGLTPFGHSYIVYGRLNAQGDMIAPQVVGFSDGDPQGAHLFAERAFVGPWFPETSFALRSQCWLGGASPDAWRAKCL